MAKYHNHTDAPYIQALEQNSFKMLIPYPCLLFRWQHDHPASSVKIATIASHKLGHHTFCTTPEKCKIVEEFIQENTPGQKKLLES